MPKRVPHLVRWFPAQRVYGVEGDDRVAGIVPGGDGWRAWLDTIESFAFHSRSGAHCTVRKETLRRGGAYWYGYRSRLGRTVKRYVGRTADLSIGRLEEVAERIAQAGSAHEEGAPPGASTPVGASAPEVDGSAFEDGAAPGASDAGHAAPASPATAGHAAPMMPLLASKLHPPRSSGALVARARLLDRLVAGLSSKLTVLSAPAGFGKTTLVRQWIADPTALAGHAVAWVSLDAGDDDPVRFWRYAIAACQTMYGDVGRVTLAQLVAALPPPFKPPSLETMLTFFLNDITRDAGKGLLILEDYHVVTMPRIHETLIFFVDHLPPTLHLVLLARNEPPLPLVRWRARGDLNELHAAELRFSLEETVDFLQQTLPYRLSEKAVAQLDARLEGWAAGLRLLALTMQGPRAPRELERYLFGQDDSAGPAQPHRPILDYFVTEVLQAQPEPLQLFLLQTSVLSRLTGPLCDAVTGRSDSKELLDAVERAGLFLESLDDSGQWYRYHALFAEAMRTEARRRFGDDGLRRLSLHASRWCEGHDLLVEAVDAALYAEDAERAASLIERLAGAGNFRYDELHTLRRWLERLPDGVRRAHPGLCLAYAMALLFTQYPDAPTPSLMARVYEALQLADDGWQSRGNLAGRGEVWAFRAMLAWRDGLVRQAAHDASQSLAWLPDDEQADAARGSTWRGVWEWRAIDQAIVATDALESGHVEEARHLFQEALRRSIAGDSGPFIRVARMLLGTACVAAGDLHQAEAYYLQVLDDARDQGDREDMVFVLIGLAELAYEWNDLDRVERLLDELPTIGALTGFPEMEEYAAFRRALLHHGRGHTPVALQQLSGILARLQAVASPRAIQAIPNALVWLGRLHLSAGDPFAARRCLDAIDQSPADISPVQRVAAQLLSARLLITQGQAEEGLPRLDRLLIAAEEQGQVRLALEIRVLTALALAASHKGHEARQQLRAALARGHGEGFLRIFLDEGEPLATLLRSLLPSLREPALASYARSILRAFTAAQQARTPETEAARAALVEPPSAQEWRVLRLLAAGRSNAEIARELVVSVNTVKGHVKSLYRKLEVRNRLEAAEAARRLLRS